MSYRLLKQCHAGFKIPGPNVWRNELITGTGWPRWCWWFWHICGYHADVIPNGEFQNEWANLTCLILNARATISKQKNESEVRDAEPLVLSPKYLAIPLRRPNLTFAWKRHPKTEKFSNDPWGWANDISFYWYQGRTSSNQAAFDQGPV